MNSFSSLLALGNCSLNPNFVACVFQIPTQPLLKNKMYVEFISSSIHFRLTFMKGFELVYLYRASSSSVFVTYLGCLYIWFCEKPYEQICAQPYEIKGEDTVAFQSVGPPWALVMVSKQWFRLQAYRLCALRNVVCIWHMHTYPCPSLTTLQYEFTHPRQ